MNMRSSHKIETERMLLRPYCQSDLDEHVAILSNWEVTRWLSTNIPFPYSREEGERFIENAKDSVAKDDSVYFSVNEKDTMRHMGGIKLFTTKSDECEIGYWLGPDFWGLGYGAEFLQVLIKWVQSNTSVKKLIAQTAQENLGSRKVLEKGGFLHQGTPPPERSKCGHGTGCSEYYVLKIKRGAEE